MLMSLLAKSQNFDILIDYEANTCNGTLSGVRENGDYNEYIFTVCPEEKNAGFYSLISANTFFDNDGGANTLSFYSGEDDNGEVLAEGDEMVNFLVKSKDPSGCITIVWTTNNNANNGGSIDLNLDCTFNCKSIKSNVTSIRDAVSGEEYVLGEPIFITKGDELTFSAEGIYGNQADATNPINNYNTYEQSDDDSEFVWFFGFGNWSSTGQKGENEINHIFDQSGVYNIELFIKDQNIGTASGSEELFECISTNPVNQQIVVKDQKPVFSLPNSEIDVCVGEDLEIIKQPMNEEHITGECESYAYASEVFIPDGTGVEIYASTLINCFDADYTMGVGDLESVEIELEHSYVGDLAIDLIAPNGETINLLLPNDQNGSYFGEPYFFNQNGNQTDQDNANPQSGNGYTYYWKDQQGIELWNEDFVGGGVTYDNSYEEFTEFESAEDFVNLAGSSVNGIWRLRISDNVQRDNGYLFRFKMNFSPDVPIKNMSFSTQISENGWDFTENPELNQSGDRINISTAERAEYEFTYFENYTNNTGVTQNFIVRVHDNTLHAGGDIDVAGDVIDFEIFRSEIDEELNENLLDLSVPASQRELTNSQTGQQIIVTDWSETGEGDLLSYMNGGQFPSDNGFENGDYQLLYKIENNLCQAADSVYFNVKVKGDYDIEGVDVLSSVACGNLGKAKLIVEKANSSADLNDLSLSWSNGNDSSFDSEEEFEAGDQSVSVSDAFGPYGDFDFSIDQIADPEFAFDNIITHLDVENNEGKVEFVISGGAEPYVISTSSEHVKEGNLVISGLAEGEHAFDIVDANGCQSQIVLNIMDHTLLGIGNAEGNGILISPNPFKNFIEVESDELIATVEIFGLNGQLLLSEDVNRKQARISTTSVKAGVYIVKVKSSKSVRVLRMISQP